MATLFEMQGSDERESKPKRFCHSVLPSLFVYIVLLAVCYSSYVEPGPFDAGNQNFYKHIVIVARCWSGP